MKVADILKTKGRDVATVQSGLTIDEAVAVLRERNIGAVIVTDADNQIAGVLSERDVVRKLHDPRSDFMRQPVSTIMTSEVICCGEADTVEELLALMTDKRIRHVPVVADGQLAGIVSIGDVVKAKIDEAEAEAAHLRDYIAAGG